MKNEWLKWNMEMMKRLDERGLRLVYWFIVGLLGKGRK